MIFLDNHQDWLKTKRVTLLPGRALAALACSLEYELVVVGTWYDYQPVGYRSKSTGMDYAALNKVEEYHWLQICKSRVLELYRARLQEQMCVFTFTPYEDTADKVKDIPCPDLWVYDRYGVRYPVAVIYVTTIPGTVLKEQETFIKKSIHPLVLSWCDATSIDSWYVEQFFNDLQKQRESRKKLDYEKLYLHPSGLQGLYPESGETKTTASYG